MKFGSLFSGIGGIDLGFERSGMTCEWQVEIDDYANRVLEKHWPRVRRWRDVRTWPQPDTEWVDLICGGDPCQENSQARQKGKVAYPSLGGEFIRVVSRIRPRFVLRENPSRVRSDAPWPASRFSEELGKLGYKVLPFRMRACCVGADHKRDRMFVFAEMVYPDGISSGLGGRVEFEKSGTSKGNVHLWPNQPEPPRVADGIPHRVHRNRLLGNSVPPPMAERIGRAIMACL